MAKQLVTNGKLLSDMPMHLMPLYISIIKSSDGKDMAWLRINDDAAFTAGVYFGSGRSGTDGNLQVGDGGSSVNKPFTSVIQFENRQPIRQHCHYHWVTSVTNTTSLQNYWCIKRKVSGGVGVASKVNSAHHSAC